MRPDMAKVLVERPRPGSSRSYHDHRHDRFFKSSDEDSPTKESMRVRYKVAWDYKEFNENLTPLRRFLGKNVNRPWNSIHSEMMEHINKDNPVQKHILTHLDNFVQFNTYLNEDGQVGYLGSWGRGEQLLSKTRSPYYVCPKGFLRVNKWARKRTKVRWSQLHPSPMKTVDGRHFLQLYTGAGLQWFEVYLERVKAPTRVYDSLGRLVSYSWSPSDVALHLLNEERRGGPSAKAVYGDANLVATRKRQISRREINSLDLEAA